MVVKEAQRKAGTTSKPFEMALIAISKTVAVLLFCYNLAFLMLLMQIITTVKLIEIKFAIIITCIVVRQKIPLDSAWCKENRFFQLVLQASWNHCVLARRPFSSLLQLPTKKSKNVACPSGK